MIEKDGVPITSLEDWRNRAGPKHPNQWKDHRSAKESARAWLEASSDVPSEIEEALGSHSDFGPIRSWTAEPEARVRFDSFRGEPPNLDVLLVAEDSTGPFVVGIEAKADETFGPVLGEKLSDVRKRLTENPRSKGLARLEALAETILGVAESDLGEVLDLRYQLLTASAAVLSEAERRGASRGILLVHEFVTIETSDDRHAGNHADLEAFVRRLAEDASLRVDTGVLCGPFSVPGSRVNLYVGKVTRDLR